MGVEGCEGSGGRKPITGKWVNLKIHLQDFIAKGPWRRSKPCRKIYSVSADQEDSNTVGSLSLESRPPSFVALVKSASDCLR